MLDTVLFVDDDLITLMLCRMVISKASFSNSLATAKNGEQALKYFDDLNSTHSHIRPQLIFLDLNMPVMNGWEFLESFTNKEYSQFHNTKIVILSSTIDPADLERSKKYPMVVDFLSKPITKEMLEYLKEKIN